MAALSRSEINIPLPTGEALPALLCEAAGSAPRPGILVVGDIGGGRRAFIDMIAGALAELGYDAIVPEFFFREGRPEAPTYEAVRARRAKLDDPRAIADLGVAIEWLRRRSQFEGARVGTVGFCLGGTFVLNLAAARDDLASVCYYGFPGETPAKAGVQGPYPLDEVGATSGPLLAFWGDRDERAGQDNISAYANAMRARDVDFEAVIYAGLDHAFLMTEWEPDAAGHELAMDAWARTQAFFASRLGAVARPAVA